MPRTQPCCSHLFKAAAPWLKGDQKLALATLHIEGCDHMRTFKGSGRCEQSTPSRHRSDKCLLFTATAHRPGSLLLASHNLGVDTAFKGGACAQVHAPSRHTVNVHSVTGFLGKGLGVPRTQPCCSHLFKAAAPWLKGDQKLALATLHIEGCDHMRTFKGSGRCEQSTPSRHRSDKCLLFTATAHRPGSLLLASHNLGVDAGQVGGACAHFCINTLKTHCERSQR